MLEIFQLRAVFLEIFEYLYYNFEEYINQDLLLLHKVKVQYLTIISGILYII